MQGVLEELQAVREYEVYQAEYQDDLENISVRQNQADIKSSQPVEMLD